MNKLATHFIAHWEQTLLFLMLLALASLFVCWQFFRLPPPAVLPPVKAMPQPPELVPWDYRPLTFMTPELSPEIHSPFLIAFDLPALPEPPTPPVS
ncbi:MAG: hypothetical protein J5654_12880, partial [Victivallales bacterium]|nr:hypothetical protein [Victivallales bacterium]